MLNVVHILEVVHTFWTLLVMFKLLERACCYWQPELSPFFSSSLCCSGSLSNSHSQGCDPDQVPSHFLYWEWLFQLWFTLFFFCCCSAFISLIILGEHRLFRTFSSGFLEEEVANLTGNDLIIEFMHVFLVTVMTSYCCLVVLLIAIQDSVTDIKLLPSHAETYSPNSSVNCHWLFEQCEPFRKNNQLPNTGREVCNTGPKWGQTLLLCDLSVMRGKLLPVALDPAPLTMKDISDMQGMYVCVCVCVCLCVYLCACHFPQSLVWFPELDY